MPERTQKKKSPESNVASATLEKLRTNLGQVIVGKEEAIRNILLALACNGHVLIEDVPGLGKTLLARSLARSISGDFKRIQFTPDLLPSDVSGISIFNQKTQEFEFRIGPIFANIVLADEINRATPRAQSSLLEAMEERTLSNDGFTYNLPRPFIVIATQNPIELVGTFPLPEAQLDRFIGSFSIGYPRQSEEMDILKRQATTTPIESIDAVVSSEEVIELQDTVRNVYVSDAIREYIVRLCAATRNHNDIHLGASPRGSLALMQASQALALFQSESFVSPDAVKEVVAFTLAHRIILKAQSRISNVTSQEIITSIVNQTTVPIKG